MSCRPYGYVPDDLAARGWCYAAGLPNAATGRGQDAGEAEARHESKLPLGSDERGAELELDERMPELDVEEVASPDGARDRRRANFPHRARAQVVIEEALVGQADRSGDSDLAGEVDAVRRVRKRHADADVKRRRDPR